MTGPGTLCFHLCCLDQDGSRSKFRPSVWVRGSGMSRCRRYYPVVPPFMDSTSLLRTSFTTETVLGSLLILKRTIRLSLPSSLTGPFRLPYLSSHFNPFTPENPRIFVKSDRPYNSCREDLRFVTRTTLPVRPFTLQRTSSVR